MSISVVKCSWVKCGEVLQCIDVLFVSFYRCVYGSMFCVIVFNSVSYVLLLCYVCSVLYILFSSCQMALLGYPN